MDTRIGPPVLGHEPVDEPVAPEQRDQQGLVVGVLALSEQRFGQVRAEVPLGYGVELGEACSRPHPRQPSPLLAEHAAFDQRPCDVLLDRVELDRQVDDPSPDAVAPTKAPDGTARVGEQVGLGRRVGPEDDDVAVVLIYPPVAHEVEHERGR